MPKIQSMAPMLLHAQPGWQVQILTASRYASALQRAKPTKHCEIFQILSNEGATFGIALKSSGREAWALNKMVTAEKGGCVPLDALSPRWSRYLHRLPKLGVHIATVCERHGGDFPSRHAKCVLLAAVNKGEKK